MLYAIPVVQLHTPDTMHTSHPPWDQGDGAGVHFGGILTHFGPPNTQSLYARARTMIVQNIHFIKNGIKWGS